MPLIDGTYEILRQQALSETETLVQATDPDGRPVRIVWYDVGPDLEPAFERHRRTLRRLGRDDDVLLRDVVSRPGAHYSVWEDPADAPALDDDEGWRERLIALGLEPEDALVRRDGRRSVLGLLRWNANGVAAGATSPPLGRVAPAGRAPAAGDEDADGRRGRPRGLPRLPTLSARDRTWLLSALLALSAACLFLVGWARNDNDRVVAVPSVAGLPAQEAADRLAGLDLTVVPQARADGDAAGMALATVPPAGAELRPGREVQLLYGLPPRGMETQEVPALVGRVLGPETEARLREAGLDAGAVAHVPADLPAGTVLAQRPAAGGRAARETEVALLVSDGPTPARTLLPDLAGLPEEEARALARIAGLPAERVLVDTVEARDAPPGSVVGMTPAPWRPLRLNDVTLRLLVAGSASGADPAGEGEGAVPDLVGLDRPAALAASADAGLTTTVERTVDPRLPPGVVLQDPAPGAAAEGPLRLLINVRPVALPVPEPELTVAEPEPRDVPYRFLIEPGIPQQTVEVRAVTADGDSTLVELGRASGGETIEGTWRTSTPGPVRFEVYLNGVFYAETRVSP